MDSMNTSIVKFIVFLKRCMNGHHQNFTIFKKDMTYVVLLGEIHNKDHESCITFNAFVKKLIDAGIPFVYENSPFNTEGTLTRDFSIFVLRQMVESLNVDNVYPCDYRIIGVNETTKALTSFIEILKVTIQKQVIKGKINKFENLQDVLRAISALVYTFTSAKDLTESNLMLGVEPDANSTIGRVTPKTGSILANMIKPLPQNIQDILFESLQIDGVNLMKNGRGRITKHFGKLLKFLEKGMVDNALQYLDEDLMLELGVMDTFMCDIPAFIKIYDQIKTAKPIVFFYGGMEHVNLIVNLFNKITDTEIICRKEKEYQNLTVNIEVIIHDLTSDKGKMMNGKHGIIQKYMDKKNRFVIAMGKKKIALKADNIKLKRIY